MERRRVLFTSGTCLGGLLGGCLGVSRVTGRGPPEYDCSVARRPPPPTDSDEENPSENVSYPQRPASLSDTTAVIEYVKQYERAYRRNALRAKYGEKLVDVGYSVNEEWTHEAPKGAAVVRLLYFYSFKYSEHAETPVEVHGDSGPTYVSYYIDGSVVIRAVDSGFHEDESELDPDPWEEGTPVDCF